MTYSGIQLANVWYKTHLLMILWTEYAMEAQSLANWASWSQLVRLTWRSGNLGDVEDMSGDDFILVVSELSKMIGFSWLVWMSSMLLRVCLL